MVLALTSCGQESLAERDPEGYAACGEYAKAKGKGDASALLGGFIEAGKHAQKAATKAIRDSVNQDLTDALEGSSAAELPIVDVKKLEKACSAAGFDF